MVIVFTDLDGTLLDHEYSFEKAAPALKLIEEMEVPLILCSSKTRAEIESCREKLSNGHPFISENGGGVFFPLNMKIPKGTYSVSVEDKYSVIKLGAEYRELRQALNRLKLEGFQVQGFGDMSVREIEMLTGLKTADAEMSKMRDFDEVFVCEGSEEDIAGLKKRINEMGFNYTEGEFYHILGDSDKGRAVNIVKSIYADKGRDIKTVALGDSPNDIEMLQTVDYPVVVQKRDGSYHPDIVDKVGGVLKAEGVGPEGWNKVLMKLLKTIL